MGFFYEFNGQNAKQIYQKVCGNGCTWVIFGSWDIIVDQHGSPEAGC